MGHEIAPIPINKFNHAENRPDEDKPTDDVLSQQESDPVFIFPTSASMPQTLTRLDCRSPSNPKMKDNSTEEEKPKKHDLDNQPNDGDV